MPSNPILEVQAPILHARATQGGLRFGFRSDWPWTVKQESCAPLQRNPDLLNWDPSVANMEA